MKQKIYNIGFLLSVDAILNKRLVLIKWPMQKAKKNKFARPKVWKINLKSLQLPMKGFYLYVTWLTKRAASFFFCFFFLRFTRPKAEI